MHWQNVITDIYNCYVVVALKLLLSKHNFLLKYSEPEVALRNNISEMSSHQLIGSKQYEQHVIIQLSNIGAVMLVARKNNSFDYDY